jgi:triosephosphate isomerase
METQTKKTIIANWKMLPTNWAEAEQILDFVNDYLESRNERELSLIFCPSSGFLEKVGNILQTSHLEHEALLGAQDISTEDTSVNIGDISGPMLNKLGVQYVIVGHSDRRWNPPAGGGEPDDIVNKKLKAVLRNTMVPIVCIGERVRDENYKEFLENQIRATFAGLSSDEIGRCLIAYEPVWAISTNPNAHPDTPESALESISVINDCLVENWKLKTENLPKVLYGGSVTSKNVAEFLKLKEIDGVLVGGASVDKEEFVKILSLVK